MKRINYLFISLSYISAILAILLIPSTYIFIEIISISILFSIGAKRCKRKNEIMRLTILNIWITSFNIIAVLLLYKDIINLYNMNSRFFVQYMIPFFIILPIKKKIFKFKSV